MRRVAGTSGMALITVIAMMMIASVAIVGLVSFLMNALALSAARVGQNEALPLAQAGVYRMLGDYLSDPAAPYWQKSYQMLDNRRAYRAGKDANFLLVSAAQSEASGSVLRNIPLTNLNSGRQITVNRVRLDWYNFPGTLTRVSLGNDPQSAGSAAEWSGQAASGTTITLSPPLTLDAKQSFFGRDTNRFFFSVPIPANAVIAATFIFDAASGDRSSRKAVLYGAGKRNEFSIDATGEVGGPVPWKRTIEATYDPGSGVITSWQEVSEHVV